MKHEAFLKTLKSLKKYASEKNTQIPANSCEETQTMQSHCICKDSFGEYKYLYSSKKELKHILSHSNIKLTYYPCPYEKGWHITKI